MTTKFTKKLLATLNLRQTKTNWIANTWSWLIDSRARRRMQLTKFLSCQLEQTSPEVILRAKKICLKPNYLLPKHNPIGIGADALVNDDQKIVRLLKWASKNIDYVPDSVNNAAVEKWDTAETILRRRKDDCDGINSLIYIMARLAGISSIQLWNAIGKTSAGYHYWLLYLSVRQDRWYAIDGSIFTDLRPLQLRKGFQLSDSKYQQIDYLFNENYAFKAR